LAASVVLAGALTGCHVPVSPGCTAEENLPTNEVLFLYVGIVTDRGVASVGIDRTGRSQFRGEHTVWMLATPGSCRPIPEEDIRLLEETWEGLSEQRLPSHSKLLDRPFLRIAFATEAEPHDLSPDSAFFLKPGSTDHTPELEEAARLTLSILARVYGDRFLREIQAAGLGALASGPP